MSGRERDTELNGRVAAITGAGRGLGLAIARRLGQAGGHVWILERDEERGLGAAKTLRHECLNATALAVDIADRTTTQGAFDHILQQSGQLDILVNNAGIAILGDSVSFSAQDWQSQVDVMLTGLFVCCQCAGAAMLQQRRGAIVNLSSIGGLGGWPQRTSYNAVKAAVANLTQSLASEWGPHGVRVNAIAPGVMRTEMIKVATDAGILRVSDYERRIPMGHLGDPTDIAAAALFLASDRATAVNGVTLRVDGGWNAWGNP
jgi:NAD(P)-dependent dehydrogenase (short-subunit alcohol dehydrogenase family)